jgi:hypothetical protein
MVLGDSLIPEILNNFSKSISFSKYGYVTKNNDLVSHMELGITNLNVCISSITIGPKSNLTPMELKLYLISKGYLKNALDKSISVHLSEATYR